MAASQGPHGPFKTEAQVFALPDVQAVFEAAHKSNRHGVLVEGGNALLLAACEAAGVELAAYDARMIRWLADFGPQGCAVFADLILRAAQGKPGPHGVLFNLVDGDTTLFVLREALIGFAGWQRDLARLGDNEAARTVWADRAAHMLDDVNAAMGEDS